MNKQNVPQHFAATSIPRWTGKGRNGEKLLEGLTGKGLFPRLIKQKKQVVRNVQIIMQIPNISSKHISVWYCRQGVLAKVVRVLLVFEK